VLFNFAPDEIKAWKRASNQPEAKTIDETVADGPALGRRALHVVMNDLTGWDTFGVSGLTGMFPKGHTLTVFSAKGDGNTSQLAVEVDEKDGSRWMAVVPLYPEWRQYVLTPKDFRFWISVEGRAGAEMRSNPRTPWGSASGLRSRTRRCPAGGMSSGSGLSEQHPSWVGT